MSSQIDHLLNETRRFAPSAEFARDAVATSDLYERAAADHEGFWGDQARDILHWHKPFTQVLDWANHFANGGFVQSSTCVNGLCQWRMSRA